MLNRISLFTVLIAGILLSAGCAAEEPKQTEQTEAKPAAPAKPVEEQVPVYELTKDDITSHAGWTSRNISVLGLKLGDKTRDKEKDLGPVDNTRTLAEEYLTVHQGNGILVYTHKVTGKARKVDVNQVFSKKIADAKLQKLLTSGDVKLMRELFGMEEGEPLQNAEENSTEYPYDSRGFRFVKFKVQGGTVNAIRFMEMRKTT